MMTLRPHHLLDILSRFERGKVPEPADSGNAVHVVTRRVGRGLHQKVRFVVGPDDICAPCSNLRADGSCTRILDRHNPPVPMDEYNDPLDRRILAYLGVEAGSVMTLGEFLRLINARAPGIEAVCTHPTQDRAERLAGLIRGLEELAVRE